MVVIYLCSIQFFVSVYWNIVLLQFFFKSLTAPVIQKSIRVQMKVTNYKLTYLKSNLKNVKACKREILHKKYYNQPHIYILLIVFHRKFTYTKAFDTAWKPIKPLFEPSLKAHASLKHKWNGKLDAMSCKQRDPFQHSSCSIYAVKMASLCSTFIIIPQCFREHAKKYWPCEEKRLIWTIFFVYDKWFVAQLLEE